MTVVCIASVVHCVSVSVHVVPVQISLHIAYQDVFLAPWGNMEFSLNWSCCFSCGVCYTPRFESFVTAVFENGQSVFPEGNFGKGQNCSHSKIAVCNGFFCLSS